jgi:6-phosphofructokinase
VFRALRCCYTAYQQGESDVKYIDPSYIIRSIPTTSNDRIYCKVLGQGAVHGAFAAYTGFTVGLVNTHYVYLPIPTIIQAPRRVNPKGRRWNRCVRFCVSWNAGLLLGAGNTDHAVLLQ